MRHRRGKDRDTKDGSAVKQKQLPFKPLRFCNRCNAEKQDNKPCTACGCPEFRTERIGGAA
jgi:hypothetical protein